MKVLWFVNAPFRSMSIELGISSYGGGWLETLAHGITTHPEIELGVVWSDMRVDALKIFKQGGISYFCVPEVTTKIPKLKFTSRGKYLISSIHSLLNIEKNAIEELDICNEIIEKFRPDIINVHGSEKYYGVITSYTSTPVLITIQGILGSVYEEYWGGIPYWARFKFINEYMLYRNMKRSVLREKKIFEINRYFSGRTNWDRQYQQILSPRGEYYSDQGRILRESFYKTNWNICETEPFSIYTTSAQKPYKSLDTLIKACNLLKLWFPKLKLKIGGLFSKKGYGNYINDLVKKFNLEENVLFLGGMSADDICRELKSCQVFVHPTYIDNSPNSLAEAQYVGTPCIASYCGGIPSMIKHYETGILFPKGDYYSLAVEIKNLFENRELAVHLSAQSKLAAQKRNNELSIVSNMINIYRQILS